VDRPICIRTKFRFFLEVGTYLLFLLKFIFKVFGWKIILEQFDFKKLGRMNEMIDNVGGFLCRISPLNFSIANLYGEEFFKESTRRIVLLN
jgi:hypothetical protein